MSLNLIDLKIHSISCILLTNWILQLIYLIKKKKKRKKENQKPKQRQKTNPPKNIKNLTLHLG